MLRDRKIEKLFFAKFSQIELQFEFVTNLFNLNKK